MTLNELNVIIDRGFKEYNKEKNISALERVEAAFETYLNENPQDTQVWLKFGMLEFAIFHDDIKALNVLKNILAYEPNNVYAVLLMAEISYIMSRTMEDEILGYLNDLETTDKELKSMIEYAKALYYSIVDKDLYKKCLKRSIDYYDKHVWNYQKLAQELKYEGNIEKSQELARKAVVNVLYILDDYEYDIPTLEYYFDVFFKGITINDIQFRLITKLLPEEEQKTIKMPPIK